MYDFKKLWNLLKSTKSLCPIFQESMTSEASKIPSTYSVISNSVSDNPFKHGDNKALYRTKTFIIRTHSDDIKKMNNIISAYQTILSNEEIDYDILGPTPDPTTGRFSTEITGSYIYGQS